MTLYRILYQDKPDGPWRVYRSRANNLTGIYDSVDSVRRVLAYMSSISFWRANTRIRVQAAEVTWGNDIDPLPEGK